MKNEQLLIYPKPFNEIHQICVLHFECSAPFSTFGCTCNRCHFKVGNLSLVVRHQCLVDTQNVCDGLLGKASQISIFIFQTKCNERRFKMSLLVVEERECWNVVPVRWIKINPTVQWLYWNGNNCSTHNYTATWHCETRQLQSLFSSEAVHFHPNPFETKTNVCIGLSQKNWQWFSASVLFQVRRMFFLSHGLRHSPWNNSTKTFRCQWEPSFREAFCSNRTPDASELVFFVCPNVRANAETFFLNLEHASIFRRYSTVRTEFQKQHLIDSI